MSSTVTIAQSGMPGRLSEGSDETVGVVDRPDTRRRRTELDQAFDERDEEGLGVDEIRQGAAARGDHDELSDAADLQKGVLIEVSIGGDETRGEEQRRGDPCHLPVPRPAGPRARPRSEPRASRGPNR